MLKSIAGLAAMGIEGPRLLLPLPACEERVAVRGTLHALRLANSPLTRRYAPTSHRKWGEVRGDPNPRTPIKRSA